MHLLIDRVEIEVLLVNVLVDYPMLLLQRFGFGYLLQNVVKLVLCLVLKLVLNLHLGEIRRHILEFCLKDPGFIKEATLSSEAKQLPKL